MKNIKLFKKIDIRVLQGLVMVLIVFAFMYLFYSFYGAFTGYRAAKVQPAPPAPAIEPLPIPELFNFTPPPEENNRFQLFLFKEKKAPAITEDGALPVEQVESYTVLGVVKKDGLFLVVRLTSNNKIHLFSKGNTIEGGFLVKSITLTQVIIIDSSGSERVHPVFQLEPATIAEEQPKEAENIE